MKNKLKLSLLTLIGFVALSSTACSKKISVAPENERTFMALDDAAASTAQASVQIRAVLDEIELNQADAMDSEAEMEAPVEQQ